MWDEVYIYQSFKNRTPILNIGLIAPSAPKAYINPVKVAHHYNSMLEQGIVGSRADLARHLGVSRAKITQILSLLKLDNELQTFLLGFDETDERLQQLSERKLRRLIDWGEEEQWLAIKKMIQ